MVDGYSKEKTRRERAKIRLHRGADGRLKPSDDDDNGDIWAQQERIRLAEALEEDKRRKERQRLREERGLVGIAKKDLENIKSKVKTELFGAATKNKPSVTHRIKQSGRYKTAEIQTALTQVNVQKPAPAEKAKRGVNKTSSMLAKSLPALGLAAGVIVVAGAGYLIFHLVYDRYHVTEPADYASTGQTPANLNVQQKPPQPSDYHPKFSSLLPKGKTIDDFGGWHVSKVATIGTMYNYSDKLDGKTIVVAQQGVPAQL